METVLLVILIILIITAAVLMLVMLLRQRKNGSRPGGKIVINYGVNIDSGQLGSGSGSLFGDGLDLSLTTVMSGYNHAARRRIVFTDCDTHKQTALPLAGSMTIGREPDSSGQPRLALENDGMVSRTHCRLFMCDGQLYIQDLHSKNFTYVNGKRITADTPLNQNDIVRVGNTRLSVTYGAGV